MARVSLSNRKVTDVRNYLKEASGADSIKYKAEKGQRQTLYIPYTIVNEQDPVTGATVQKKAACAISVKIHKWTDSQNKFHSIMCTDNESGDGISGVCPFCARTSDAWDIYNYRKEVEEKKCKLTGDARDKHMQSVRQTLMREKKANEAESTMYLLVVQFKTGAKDQPVLDSAGIPEYDLKVMKMSTSALEKITTTIENSRTTLEGAEIVFGYPNEDDIRLLYGQRSVSVVFPDNRITTMYPAVVQKINEDVAQFNWDSISSAFPELDMWTDEKAKSVLDDLFSDWDNYLIEKKTNPNAVYLEDVTGGAVNNPELSASKDNPDSIVNLGAGTGSTDDLNSLFGGGIPELRV